MEQEKLKTETNNEFTTKLSVDMINGRVSEEEIKLRENEIIPIKKEIKLNDRLMDSEIDSISAIESKYNGKSTQIYSPILTNANNKTKKVNKHMYSNSMNGANKGKLLYDAVSERKDYEQKIIALKNRIKKLQDQEKDIEKKVRQM